MLAAVDVGERVQLVLDWARNHVAELQVAESIRNDVTEGVDKQQREYPAPPAARSDPQGARRGRRRRRCRVPRRSSPRCTPPEAAYNTIAKEIDRLERTSSQSPEHGWIRTWLDRVFELPWNTRSDDNLDLANVRAVLDADHYGLDDVKARIVEFMAVRKLRSERGLQRSTAMATRPAAARRPRHHGAIITLVGPPGVGKTSLGESVARAMGRKFVRVALGGIRDEAEIRGHRRTYVGSQPGRIAKAMVEAGTSNPVILLDEVDKLSPGGWSGDPTAALLEVLDPAQNHTFRDHYLELDLDLSDVVFIATANLLDTVPAPLLDRMDVVRLDGYTDDEKVFIARRYLLPRQLERAGLQAGELDVDDATIVAVIRNYTREAGVRSLERELGRLARKAAAKIAAGEAVPDVAPGVLSEWLGRPKLVDDVPDRTELPGVATGLAVTGAGGDVLFIETTAFPTGPDTEPGLTLTGQLGDVMKESAQIALNYVRSHAGELGVDPGVDAPPLPRPRAGRRRAQGRAVGRHHDDDGAGQPAPRPGGEADGRHDRRDHPAGRRAPDRRRQAEGARRPPRRTHRGGAAEAQRRRPRRRPRAGPRGDDVPPRRHLRRRRRRRLRLTPPPVSCKSRQIELTRRSVGTSAVAR